MLNLRDVLAVVPGVVTQASEDGLVVVLPQKGKYMVLNGSGAVVFELIDGRRTLQDVAAALCDRYEGLSAEQAQKDVSALAKKLVARGVLVAE